MSVLYVTEDWEELEDLLYAPSSFFDINSRDWTQSGVLPNGKELKEPFDWTLLRPSSVVLQWIGDSGSTLHTFAPIIAEKIMPELSDEGGGALTEEEKAARIDEFYRLLSEPKSLAQRVMEDYPNGLIIAQFAIDTSTLLLMYSPPAKAPEPKFRGTYTNATLCKILPNLESSIGMTSTVHFDIGRGPLVRAQFICDYLTNWIGTLQEATKIVLPDKHLSLHEARLVPRGGDIVVLPIARAISDLEYKLPPYGPEYPTVYAEGMSGPGPDPNLVCIEVSGVWTPPPGAGGSGTFMPGSTIVKCYMKLIEE
jgi:hypothetical protein